MSAKTLPRVRKASFRYDVSKAIEWLWTHQQEYIGEWVVLDGNGLIGLGDDPRPIVAQARAEGVQIPFVEFIHDSSEPFLGGWL